MPRVYIGRLSYHIREKDIQRFFSGYGKLMEIDLKNGYGFVEFEDSRDADDAVYELNGKELCGERVIVEHARGPRRDRDSRSRSGRDKYGPPVRTEYRLIVENLSSRCSWQDLKDFMRQAGEVTYADAHKERTNEGVIEFRSYSDMKRALDKLDGTDINGRKIRLVEDRPRKRRSRSRSQKSKSRSQSRKSRSRSAERKSKSRSKSRSKVKSERDSRSRSKELSGEKKSRSRSASPVENGKEERAAKSASRSPSPQEADRRSKSREKRSASRSVSRSRSRSRSRSASRD
uniref:Serine and arginine rich splicing factor 6 n=1 Tax=Kryptolebias marmoratus TaxID=37003 RepID=A0A3Q3AI22_KRYMA